MGCTKQGISRCCLTTSTNLRLVHHGNVQGEFVLVVRQYLDIPCLVKSITVPPPWHQLCHHLPPWLGDLPRDVRGGGGGVQTNCQLQGDRLTLTDQARVHRVGGQVHDVDLDVDVVAVHLLPPLSIITGEFFPIVL